MTTQVPFTLELPTSTSTPTKTPDIMAEPYTKQFSDESRVSNPEGSAIMSGFLVTPDYVGLFGSPDLQQQAEKIENAVAVFCRHTLDSLLRLGDILNKFLKECIDKLGDKKGKSIFEEWLQSGNFGGTKYIALAAMAISNCFLELDNDTKELARKNVNTWSVGALKALAKAAKVSVLLLKALVKRGGNISEKTITNVTDLVEEKQPKQPTLPPGGFVEVVVDDERQLKGKIGVIDNKDKDGNIVVRLVDTGTDVTLKSQDVTKKTPKSVNQCLIQVIEELHQESLEKDLKLNEYQSAIISEPTTEVLEQSERDRIAADAIATYKEQQAQKDTALYEDTKAAALAEIQVRHDAALAAANTQIETLNQTIQKLAKQVEDKERLTQVIEDLQQQLKEQALRSQHLEEQNQQLRQQVAEFQSALAGTWEKPPQNERGPYTQVLSSETKLSRPEARDEPMGKGEALYTTTVCRDKTDETRSLPLPHSGIATLARFERVHCRTVDLPSNINKQEVTTNVGSIVSSNHDIQSQEVEPQKSYNEPATSERLQLATVRELNEYKAAQLEKSVTCSIEISQAEFLEIKNKLEVAELKNIELVEANEVLVEMMEILKLEHAGEKLKEHRQKLENNFGKNNSRKSATTASKPLGFMPKQIN